MKRMRTSSRLPSCEQGGKCVFRALHERPLTTYRPMVAAIPVFLFDNDIHPPVFAIVVERLLLWENTIMMQVWLCNKYLYRAALTELAHLNSTIKIYTYYRDRPNRVLYNKQRSLRERKKYDRQLYNATIKYC